MHYIRFADILLQVYRRKDVIIVIIIHGDMV